MWDPYLTRTRHAAASYGHIPLLDYLVSVGGDVNIRDSDEETPLFTVEDWDTMSWLVDHECDIGATNVEGLTVRVTPLSFLLTFPLI